MIVKRLVRRLEGAGYSPDEAVDLVVKAVVVLIAPVQIPVTIFGTVGLIELLR